MFLSKSNLVFKNLAYIIPLKIFRKTPNVEFLKINKVIDAERNSKIKNYYQSWLLNKDKEAHNTLIEKLN